ncbi:trypsin-like peptidase domain-containing protein [Hymenobacter busanensis]|uniref:Trypsin-like peptidase domain-containing protein n=1 Tax=Hymenobacter busanensis TaxID=2607656 RepID=A0A7L5A271_9BACT|nr:serine protease [Hymenobacter busanensis]KAA9331379.1 trypsin-like peptidase domain-containing protein [Hymenobacter busanensis]QHJ08532.1 trypsin-like serine protease [Hymenobacter busanensis]
MMTEADYYALFEDYEAGRLDAPVRADLERRLAADPVLASRFAEYHDVTGTLHAYGQRLRVSEQLRAFQAEIDAEQETTVETGRPTMPVMHISRTEKWLREFWHGHRATMAVAASVAVLAVFGTLLGLEWWKAHQQPSAYGYTVLRRDVDRIKRDQKALTRSIKQIDGKALPAAPINNGKFSGTGFALTADGYVVTSYHVIQGADSLLIESRDRQRYRAEPVFTDVAHDLAILRVNQKGFAGFGRLPYTVKRREADLGERVYTLGYPREDLVFNDGSLSARSGFEGDTGFYQISIPVNPGNSGGPVLDDRGNLIGVISGRQMDVQSAAFATKSSYLMRLVDSLSAAGSAPGYNVPRTNLLAGQSRPQQLRKLQDFVFVVKVYE